MINEFRQSKYAGTFTVSSEKEVYGELTLDGRDSSLYLRDKDHFEMHDIPDQCVKGILHDLTKVTLLKCIPMTVKGRSTRGKQSYNFAKIFPHYVVYGDQHISPSDKKILSVHFVVDDAPILFFDFDAFGHLIDARPYIEQIAHANGLKREVAIGPNPQILYFTGKREIFVADTVFGKVSAYHSPALSLGSPEEVSLKNSIFVTITFRELATFNEMIDSMSTLLLYLAMLVGRQQNLIKIKIGVTAKGERPDFLEVYWSMQPKRASSHKIKKLHPGDVLLDAVRQPEVFSRVLTGWLERHEAWNDARQRFFNSFRKEYYSIDRLIGATNMFDILPPSAVPPKIQLAEELKNAKNKCNKIFKDLPSSPERDSILNALGRIGESVLKHKIRHRGQILVDIMGKSFPDLFTVTDEAVNCRNHYVHGSKPIFDYSKEFDMFVFFTHTLEFVFAASDLIEAGWDVKAWSTSSGEHPFGKYYGHYLVNLEKLKGLIA